MARSRNIKPGFFKNEILAKLDANTRLLFIGLWVIADREGRFEVRLEKIKAEIFPHEQIMLEPCMAHLWDKQFITLFEHCGKHYGQVNNWNRHQSPHHKELSSQIPPCDTEKVFNNQDELHAWLMHESSMKQSRFNQIASSPLIPDTLNLIPDSNQSINQPDARGAFHMFTDWQPSDHVESLAKQSGSPIIDGDLQEFIAHWLTKPIEKRTQAEWDKALMNTAKHRKLRGDSTQTTGGKPKKFDPVEFVNGGGESGQTIEHTT